MFLHFTGKLAKYVSILSSGETDQSTSAMILIHQIPRMHLAQGHQVSCCAFGGLADILECVTEVFNSYSIPDNIFLVSLPHFKLILWDRTQKWCPIPDCTVVALNLNLCYTSRVKYEIISGSSFVENPYHSQTKTLVPYCKLKSDQPCPYRSISLHLPKKG